MSQQLENHKVKKHDNARPNRLISIIEGLVDVAMAFTASPHGPVKECEQDIDGLERMGINKMQKNHWDVADEELHGDEDRVQDNEAVIDGAGPFFEYQQVGQRYL